jgi:hypothetical protein
MVPSARTTMSVPPGSAPIACAATSPARVLVSRVIRQVLSDGARSSGQASPIRPVQPRTAAPAGQPGCAMDLATAPCSPKAPSARPPRALAPDGSMRRRPVTASGLVGILSSSNAFPTRAAAAPAMRTARSIPIARRELLARRTPRDDSPAARSRMGSLASTAASAVRASVWMASVARAVARGPVAVAICRARRVDA